MSNIDLPLPSQPVSIPIGEWLPWAIFAALICLIAIYFVGAEQDHRTDIRHVCARIRA